MRHDPEMKIDIDLEESHGFCRVKVVGKFDLSEYAPSINRVVDAMGDTPDMPALYDLRETDMAHIGTSEIRAMGSAHRGIANRRGTARVAVLVGDDLTYGLARMYEALGMPPKLQMQVFRNVDEAEAWVSLSPSEQGG